MRVMTFNIQHALDYQSKKNDVDLFVNAIKKHRADICCLNEVRGNGPIEGYTDQTNTIGNGLDFYRYFGEAIKVEGTSPYGNAIVSRFPFKTVETIAIPETDDRSEESNYEPRCVIKTVTEIEDKEICILICHMGLSNSERINAVETLCEIIDNTELPIILTGDFNTYPEDKVLKPIYERLLDADEKADRKGVFTYASYSPEIKIDYIFYRGLECTECRVIEEIYSDHFPIIAEFI